MIKMTLTLLMTFLLLFGKEKDYSSYLTKRITAGYYINDSWHLNQLTTKYLDPTINNLQKKWTP